MAQLQWDVPAFFNFGDVVDGWAESQPDHEALLAIDRTGALDTWSYGRVSKASSEVAARLSALGVRRGDRVVVMLPRGPHWHVTMVGCLKLGAIAVPCITMLTGDDLAYRLRDCAPTCVITTVDCADRIRSGTWTRAVVGSESPSGWVAIDDVELGRARSTNAQVGRDEPAVVYYTSGSTGLPKGATLSAGNLYAWRNAAEHWLGLRPTDRIWCTADTGWSKAGCSTLFGPWTKGATSVVLDGPFDPGQRLDVIQRVGVTVYCAPATELRRVLAEPVEEHDLSALRLTASAGESVGPELLEEWTARTGATLLDGYGQTENLMTVANRGGQAVKPGSMGTPLPGLEMAVITDDDRVEHLAAVGQLVLRSPSPQLMLGYWGDPERTAAAYRDLDGATWFLTGDVASVDTDGYITFLGRIDDVISSSGYRIGPQEVENAVASHPGVTEVAVVGQPDATRGEIVTAFVVLAPGIEPSKGLIVEIQDHARRMTAAYKYPRAVAFVDSLPRTPSGKVRRDLLRSRHVIS